MISIGALSCGHSVLDDCKCGAGVDAVSAALAEYRYKWRDVLAGYGVELRSNKKGQSCPVCGGRDRFIFDDKDGLGTWFCRGCDPQAGGGLLLLSRCIGKSVLDTAKELIDGLSLSAIKAAPVVIYDEAARRAEYVRAAGIAANMIARCTISQHDYLTRRGLFNFVSVAGGKIIVPIYHGKKLVNAQSIDRSGKKLFIKGGLMKSCYHAIAGVDHKVALCEGYATGLTVNALTGLKTYCAFSASNCLNIARLLKGSGRDVLFFADRDAHHDKFGALGAGGFYAEKARSETGCKIVMPPTLGDWDDIRQKEGEKKALAEMREAASANNTFISSNNRVIIA